MSELTKLEVMRQMLDEYVEKILIQQKKEIIEEIEIFRYEKCNEFTTPLISELINILTKWGSSGSAGYFSVRK